jgi:hypothetical protein
MEVWENAKENYQMENAILIKSNAKYLDIIGIFLIIISLLADKVIEWKG